MKKGFFIILALLITVSSVSAQINWRIDKVHSEVQFKVKHMVITTVTGEFKDYNIIFSSDKSDDFESAKLETVIKTASIFTDNNSRDSDLRSDNFLNVEMFPEIKFVSKSFKRSEKEGEKNIYKVIGDLTIRDVTKSVELTAEYAGSVPDRRGGTRIAFHVTGAINRFDFGVKFNRLIETGGMVVSEIVKFDFNLAFIGRSN